MKNIMKLLILAFLCALFLMFYHIVKQDSISLSEIILAFSFSAFENVNTGDVSAFSVQYFPFIVFQCLYGITIYKRFCLASVYYFSRQVNKSIWFLKETSRLFLLCFLFVFCLLAASALIVFLFGNAYFDNLPTALIVYHLALNTMWIFILTFCLNILAVKTNSSTSLAIIGGFQTFCFSLYILTMRSMDDENSNIVRYNPLSHLILAWHKTTNTKLRIFLDAYRSKNQAVLQTGIDLKTSLFLFVMIAIIAICIGRYVINRQEIITINQETGGN